MAPRSAVELIDSLRGEIDRVISPMLRGAGRVALVGYPTHWNIGDSLIWLGATRYLRTVPGLDLAYVCHPSTYRKRLLGDVIADGPILITGGGNTGDVWPRAQLFRERLIRDFPDNPIIQLPQSINFREPQNAQRFRSLASTHQRFTLVARDRESVAVARDQLGLDAALCPDMALFIGATLRPVTDGSGVLHLLRDDAETGDPRARPGEATDWPDESSAWLLAQRALAVLARRGYWPARLLQRPTAYAYEALARQRLARGSRLLGGCEVLVTDRLHGHILAVLLGIEHYVVGDRFGKVRAFYETWTHECEHAHWCDSVEEALARTRQL